MGKGSANAGDVNAAALYSLGRVLRDGRSGFYALVASPRTQAAVVKQYAGDAVRVYDFSRESRELVKISELMDSEPKRKAYIFLNFHLALWDVDKWDINAVRRLNFSRNALSKRNRTLIFCITPEADTLLNRRAYDFYDYIKLFFRFKDEETASKPETITARSEEQSIGFNVTVDFSLPEEKLLSLAISLGNQAKECYEKARYSEALTFLQNQCEIQERVFGTENSDTAAIYNNIGIVYSDLGEYASALEWYQKALHIKERVLGTNHPNMATLYSNIGNVYRVQGDYDSALECHQKALRISEHLLGTDYPNAVGTYNNIASVYYEMGDYVSALEYYQKALRISERILGTEHPNTATSYNNIASIYHAQGDYDAALEWYQKALYVKETILGTNHPDTATIYQNIGGLYWDKGNFKEALKWLEKALAIRLKFLGAEHPDTKDTQEWIDDARRALSGDA